MDKPRILVVDDERGPRESLRMILKEQYEVALAETPHEGLRLVERFRPDVVFLDIRMPQMHGTEVLRRIKELDDRIEVAMVTAYADVESAQQAVRLGAIDYLNKPFGMNEVMRVAERALARRLERQEQETMLDQLQRATRDLAEQVTELRRKSDFADLSTIFDGLASAQHSVEAQLDGMARLRAIGEIAAEVAHDVDNFLSAILLRIELLQTSLRDAPSLDHDTLATALQEIAQATTDSAHAIARISLMSEEAYEPSQTVDLNAILREAASLSVGQASRGREARLVWETEELPSVTGSAEGLRTALVNVILNARQALPEGHGEIRLRTFREGDQVVIEVSDTGVGIASDVLNRVTDPFFTTKGEAGRGLGLSVARKVISRHGGTLAFESELGQGTTVTIRLPVEGRPAAFAAAASAVPDVLVVDDDERLLDLIASYLRAASLEVQTAATGMAGWRQFEQYLVGSHRAPQVVITDARLPDLPGSELAQRVKQAAPDTRILLLTAYVTPQGEPDTPQFDAIMSKPLDLPVLLQEVVKLGKFSVS
jgi:signal transduction histidine kinase